MLVDCPLRCCTNSYRFSVRFFFFLQRTLSDLCVSSPLCTHHARATRCVGSGTPACVQDSGAHRGAPHRVPGAGGPAGVVGTGGRSRSSVDAPAGASSPAVRDLARELPPVLPQRRPGPALRDRRLLRSTGVIRVAYFGAACLLRLPFALSRCVGASQMRTSSTIGTALELRHPHPLLTPPRSPLTLPPPPTRLRCRVFLPFPRFRAPSIRRVHPSIHPSTSIAQQRKKHAQRTE